MAEEKCLGHEVEENSDSDHSLENMEVESCLDCKKMGKDLLRSIWSYFGMPPEYIQKVKSLNDKPFAKVFTHFVAKAVVVDILENRGLHSALFERIFDISSEPDKDVLYYLDVDIISLIQDEDTYSAFITFCSILSDFMVFLRYKGNLLKINRKRLAYYFEEFYDGCFEKKITELGGLKAILNLARKKAGIYPHKVLKKFTSKYCKSNAHYNENNIPHLFQTELYRKYEGLRPTALFQ